MLTSPANPYMRKNSWFAVDLALLAQGSETRKLQIFRLPRILDVYIMYIILYYTILSYTMSYYIVGYCLLSSNVGSQLPLIGKPNSRMSVLLWSKIIENDLECRGATADRRSRQRWCPLARRRPPPEKPVCPHAKQSCRQGKQQEKPSAQRP